MKKIFSVVFWLPFILLSMSSVQAGSAEHSAEKRLNQFFNNVRSMKAEFTQTIISDAKSEVEKSTGILQMERPGKFRWDYQFPYEQEIVADGRRLWIYDIEMEQVIVKPLDLVLGNTPAVLLSGNAIVTDKFQVTEITASGSDDKGLFWMQLTPKQEEAGFEKLLLAFSGSNLRIMELKDAFGRVTRISFSNLTQNPKIESNVFDFIVPPGVDVIDDANSDKQ